MFRKSGAKCKASAEKGSHICHAHAGQLATAVRRERERRAVLAEAVARMRKRGKPDCETADLFMDFKGIQVTLEVMAQALIGGLIECKTAGRLVVQLQTVSKLLRMVHRTKTKTLPRIYTDNTDLKESAEETRLPQIRADERRLGKPGEKAHSTTEWQRHPPHQAKTGLGGDPGGEQPREERNWAANHSAANPWGVKQGGMKQGGETRIALVTKVRAFAEGCCWGHAPPELLRTA
ncbi:MAG TPA: hypothetical protein VGQ12_04340 [Candidatus Angelobacter sp.]|nr:hypothetical protein [Candidatus Angelobacter sp.]